jgi:hypothetical protein
MPIVAAIHKYGKKNFEVSVLQECKSQEEMDSMEIHYSKIFNSMCPDGYNLKVGQGRGYLNEEVKEKISVKNTGKIRSEEAILNLRKSHLGHKKPDKELQVYRELYKNKCVSLLGPIAAAERLAKEYDVISPDGIFFHIKNMKQFCLKNNLSPSKMCYVVKGIRNHHKGWRVGG